MCKVLCTEILYDGSGKWREVDVVTIMSIDHMFIPEYSHIREFPTLEEDGIIMAEGYEAVKKILI